MIAKYVFYYQDLNTTQQLIFIIFSIFSDIHRGFIHDLSLVKRSRNDNQWYEFNLQTSPSKIRRVVGFNIRCHPTLQEHEKSKTPVVLKNTQTNSENHILFNQQSSVRIAPTFDIDFDYSPTKVLDSTASSSEPTLTITLKQLSELQPNQKVNVIGTISLGKDKPKPVQIKSTQKMSAVKEDCMLEDDTGTAILHIWDPLIKEVINGTSYNFQNLTIKHFKGTTLLSTSPSSSIMKMEQQIQLQNPSGQALLENPDKDLKVEQFKLVKQISIFVACQACKRKIHDISQNSIKCKYCGVRQRKEACNKDATVQLAVDDPEIGWLTAFTEVIQALLAVDSKLTLDSNSDEIEDHLLKVKNIEFTYDASKKVIKKLSSVSL